MRAAYEVTTPATTEKEGEGTYTATFENEAFDTQTMTESIAKLPVTPNKPGSTVAKPATQGTATPATGDQTNMAIPVAIAVIGIAVIAGAAVVRKRNK